MRLHTALLAFSALATISPAFANPSADEILKANQTATAGSTWGSKPVFQSDYAYAGQGLTGKVHSLADVRDGKWVDEFAIGPITGGNGYDGTIAWQKDQSGTVTTQDGGEAAPLAVNDGYRRANLWWRADHGGAEVTADPQKTDAGVAYDVITVVPKKGKTFDAWFDGKTHLLSRVIESQGTVPTTFLYSDYSAVDGVILAHKTVQSTGNAKYDQSFTLTGAKFVAAQDAAFAMPESKGNDFAIAGGAEATFPFQLVNNHIYADVKINGKGPYTFIFDTGGVNVVTPALAKTLGIAVEGQTEARGGGEGTMEAGFAKVGSIDLGGATIKDQVFASIPLDSFAHIEGREMPGMVGFETFRRFVTRIDYGAKTITLIDPKAFDAKNAGTAVPIVFDGNVPEAEGSYNGHTGKFMIDTGARNSLILTTPFSDKNSLRTGVSKGVESVTGWGVGGPTRSYVFRGGELKIGSVAVPQVISQLSTDKSGAMASSDLAGNIGGGVLKQYVVTFDYGHNTMYLKPVTHAVDDLNTFDRAGIWVNKDPAGLTIVDVTGGAPAAEAGLKKDDVITAVNGTPVADVALPDLRYHLRNDAPGTVMTFAVKRDGSTKDVKVTLRELI
jgi:predicted aspartyl protease